MAEHAGAPRRTPVALLAAFVAASLLGGCASIPVAGPVQPGLEIRLDDPEPGSAPVIASPPRPGSDPVEILQGFLQASADFRGDHETARLFLDPATRRSWQPDAGTTVYSVAGDDYGIRRTYSVAGEAVRLEAEVVATIDEYGQYTPVPDQTLDTVFTFTRVSGEWRIASVPPGLYLTPFEVSETYRQVELYFLSPDREIVVPNLVFVPVLPGLPTALVRRLLSGPTPRLEPAVTTAFPGGTDLAVSAVAVADGVASVDLNRVALQATGEVRDQMVAQLVWTLTQLPEVESVQVTIDGSEAGPGSVPTEQTRENWASYDPNELLSTTAVYLVRDGQVGTLTGSEFVPLPGRLGRGEIALRWPAVSLDGSRIAGLNPDGNVLLAGRIEAEDDLVNRFAGVDLAPPAYGPEGLLWVLDRDPENNSVWVLPPSGEQTRVTLPVLGDSRVVAVRPSRDGIRVALVIDDPGEPATDEETASPSQAGPGQVVGDRLLVGVLRRGPGLAGLAVQNAQPVAPEIDTITDLAWADPARLLVLGAQDEGAPAPFAIDADGSSVEALVPTPGLTSIAAGPEQLPVLAGTSEGEVVQYSGRRWVPIGRGTEPAYPG